VGAVTPFSAANHVALCGYVNVFVMNDNGCLIDNFSGNARRCRGNPGFVYVKEFILSSPFESFLCVAANQVGENSPGNATPLFYSPLQAAPESSVCVCIASR
jgi:hypothetical protein